MIYLIKSQENIIYLYSKETDYLLEVYIFILSVHWSNGTTWIKSHLKCWNSPYINIYDVFYLKSPSP